MISEIDINDMQELYKLQRGDLFKIVDDDIRIPPAAPLINTDTIYKLLNIDGMYANIRDSSGLVSYVAAWTMVKKMKG